MATTIAPSARRIRSGGVDLLRDHHGVFFVSETQVSRAEYSR